MSSILADPSHATGKRAVVPPLVLAAVAAGAGGVMVEAHPEPDRALSDGPQSLTLEQLDRLRDDVDGLLRHLGRESFAPREVTR